MAEHRSTRCPACGRFVKILLDGTFAKHTKLKDLRSGECPMSRHRPPTPEAAELLREVLRAAFWEHFGLAYEEWGPGQDDESTADAAIEALRTGSFLVVDGQIYLVTSSHEVSETAGERQWTITTNDEGDAYGARFQLD